MHSLLLITSLFLVFFSSNFARAEYRVFTLHIINRTNQQTKQIETTLDPEQFISFYPLKVNEEISYIETWRCHGRTDFFKSHCENPRLLDQGPVVAPSQSPELIK